MTNRTWYILGLEFMDGRMIPSAWVSKGLRLLLGGSCGEEGPGLGGRDIAA